METSGKMAKKKLKSATNSNAFAYKHFNTTGGNKRRKNRKKYFEHDTRTRTRTVRTAQSKGGGGSVVKKINFNNEINIFETKSRVTNETDVSKCKTKAKPFKLSAGQKKRLFRHRRNGGGGSGSGAAATSTANIQTATKRLIETQKKLQKQLNALQEHQREQNSSFLALIHSNCMHTNAMPNDTELNTVAAACKSTIDTNDLCFNSNAHCSEHFYPFFTDQSKCSIDKMANGTKATAIRTFNCDSKSKGWTTTVPTEPVVKSYTPPRDTTNCHCGTCNTIVKTATAISDSNLTDTKKLNIHIKKPLLKSIVFSTKNRAIVAPNIKQEINDTNDYQLSSTNIDSLNVKSIETKLQTDMQFTDTKKTNKQINSYFKSNEFVARSYSPPLPATHRLASMVTNKAVAMTATAHNATGANNSDPSRRRSHSLKDRKSRSRKRKRRRASNSRDSRSKSRSYSRSRSRSSSKSRSSTRSPTRSRSRSYRRHSTRSRSASSEYNSRHRHSQDRKKHSHSKNRDVFRRSTSKRNEKGCGCNCNCTKYCKKSTKHLSSSNKSKSPSNDSAFSSKQSNTSPTDSRRIKRSTTSSSDANGSTSKKKSAAISSGVLLKPQPIVKLHSSPVTGSDTENEIDDKFDRKYEELLTFETNEDERREQRLLKALSDIAAKAKQKIQSITESGVPNNVHADRNHNECAVPKSNRPPKHSANKSNEVHDANRSIRPISEDRYDHDYSPRDRKPPKRDPLKRSRRDSSCSSTSKDEKSPRSSRSPSIPRRRGSPSFLDRRRITSARKKPIPYQRSSPYDSYDEWDSS